MFAANKIVSSKQLNRIIITENAALALLFGGALAGELGSLAYAWLLILGLALSMAYMWLALKISEKYADKLLRSKIFNIIAALRFMAMACVGIYIFYGVVRDLLLNETAGFIIVAGIMLLSIYEASRHYEERGRLHQILGIFVILLILIILVTASFKIDLGRAFDDLAGGFKMPNKKGFIIWLFMLLMTSYYEKLIIVSPHYHNSYGKRIALLKSPLVIWLGALWAYVLCVNIFGSGASLFKLMDISGIPGGFLNRQETIMAIFLVISLTSYVSGMLYYIRQCIKNIFIRYTKKPRLVTRRIVSAAALTAVFVCSVMLGIYVDGAEKMTEGRLVGAREIENLDFVMSMTIGSKSVVLELADITGDNGESIYVTYDYDENIAADEIISYLNNEHTASGSNRLDFSHIKGIVLYDISQEQQEKITEEFKKNSEISGNVSVYRATAAEYPDLMTELAQGGQDIRLGQMLENMLKNVDKYSDNMLYLQ